jgi:hypothetical protein
MQTQHLGRSRRSTAGRSACPLHCDRRRKNSPNQHGSCMPQTDLSIFGNDGGMQAQSERDFACLLRRPWQTEVSYPAAPSECASLHPLLRPIRHYPPLRDNLKTITLNLEETWTQDAARGNHLRRRPPAVACIAALYRADAPHARYKRRTGENGCDQQAKRDV